MLVLWLPIWCWALIAVLLLLTIGAGAGKVPIPVFLVGALAIWVLGLAVIAYDFDNDFPDDALNTTPPIGPGYGWSCLPVNDSTGEVLCRPVTVTGGGP